MSHQSSPAGRRTFPTIVAVVTLALFGVVVFAAAPATAQVTRVQVSGSVTAGNDPLPEVYVLSAGGSDETDGAGEFSYLANASASGFIALERQASNSQPGFLAQVGSTDLSADVDMDLVLPAIAPLTVNLVDPAGQPIDGRVYVTGELDVAGAPPQVGSDPMDRFASWEAYPTWSWNGAVTVNGFVDPAMAANFQIEVGSDNFNVAWDGQNPTTVTLDVGVKSTISGSVFAGPEPVADVTLLSVGGAGETNIAGQFSYEADAVSPGFVALEQHQSPAGTGFLIQLNDTDLSSDVSMDLVLPALEPLTVNLVDSSGQSVDGRVYVTGDLTVSGAPPQVGSDPEDRFATWEAYPEWTSAGSVTVNAYLDPTAATTFQIEVGSDNFNVAWDGQNPTTVTVAAPEKVTVSGSLVAGTRPQAGVSLLSAGGQGLTDADGTFAYPATRDDRGFVALERQISPKEPGLLIQLQDLDLSADLDMDLSIPELQAMTVEIVNANNEPVHGWVRGSADLTVTGAPDPAPAIEVVEVDPITGESETVILIEQVEHFASWEFNTFTQLGVANVVGHYDLDAETVIDVAVGRDHFTVTLPPNTFTPSMALGLTVNIDTRIVTLPGQANFTGALVERTADRATRDAATPPYTCAGRVATMWGTSSGETLTGTPGPDVIVALGGDDVIDGRGGNDVICAGAGNDVISGGAGRDLLIGSIGNDIIRGDGGSDWIRAGDGDDLVLAGSGADHVRGGAGNDMLRGMGGQDRIYGEAGNDVLQGNASSDRLYGGSGNDILRGAAGRDRLYGGPGHDDLYGGDNTDFLDGGTGIDHADGQRGIEGLLIAHQSGCIAETRVRC